MAFKRCFICKWAFTLQIQLWDACVLQEPHAAGNVAQQEWEFAARSLCRF